ncbi:MAG: hypothetical protein GY793_03515 [Proteobacteria bacterium]|nr:hypothetical protein [Pseudomonadota bacterium]
MRKILFILITIIIVSFFIAYDQGYPRPANPKGFSEEYIRKELNLPPYPSRFKNNSTYLGINSNPEKNQIRDDIEIEIALRSYPNMREIYLLNRAAEIQTELYHAYKKGDKKLYLGLTLEKSLHLSCNSYYFHDFDNTDLIVLDLFSNTNERSHLILKMDYEMTRGTSSPVSTYKMREKECPKFKDLKTQ